MPKSTTNLNLSTYDLTTDKEKLSKVWFDETFGYTDSNMTKIDDAFGGLKDSVPTKTGEGASGNWDINITGTAQTAVNDGAGNDINSTYIKEVEAKDGTLTVKKGDNTSSTVDISSPKGYILSKDVYFSGTSYSEETTWLHVGNIKNTSDGNLIEVIVNVYIDYNAGSSTTIEAAVKQDMYIHDKVQESAQLLNTAYTLFQYDTLILGITSSDQQSTMLADNEESNPTTYLVPTSGGNGTSGAELWISIPLIQTKVSVTVITEDKNKWEFVLEEKSQVTTSEFKISPLKEANIITSEDTADTSSAGVVKIGSGIKVDESGVISVSPAQSAYAGGVKAGGDNIDIASDGTISVPTATSATKGVVKIGQNLTVSDGTVSVTQDNVSSAIGFAPTKITAGTTDLTAGTSFLETGTVYLYYV